MQGQILDWTWCLPWCKWCSSLSSACAVLAAFFGIPLATSLILSSEGEPTHGYLWRVDSFPPIHFL
ncbi:hypothetical protein BS47DRAFT_526403 [Hydnum rufescens UP504]|uniref:Uncharacterized protein n=1 Tax=Hydnum rufescens UP504 TaxID=1448309 RepID=A0A9P6B440_9AGAM|nr:hypothetical protein BS47DRAFT_526403 [Hydnum rufescens UP504]